MMSDEEKPASNGPIDEVKAYFKTVPWFSLNFNRYVFEGSGYDILLWILIHAFQRKKSIGCFLKLPEVISTKNLGEHLNEVFADRTKMEAASSLHFLIIEPGWA